jgi:hypothetical protein
VIEEKEGVFIRNLFSQIHLFFQLEDKRGKVISSVNRKFDYEIDEKSQINRPAIYFGQELEKGHYKIKMALKDKIGGEIVTQEKIVEVKDRKSMSKVGMGVNNFFFVKRDALNRELNELEDIFIYEEEKLYPRMNVEFQPEEDLNIYFEVNSTDEMGIDLYFKVICGENELFKTYQMSSPIKSKITPFLISIPLSDFRSGEYIFQVTAIERGMRKYSIVRENFKVKY